MEEAILDLAEAGRQAAATLWEQWGKIEEAPYDPRTPEFANAAIDEFAKCQSLMPGALEAVLNGAARGAEELNLSDFHGIIEILQNADDVHASAVSVRLGQEGADRKLYIIHDGEPVLVQHVLAMAMAFLSTKADDPDLKGKFGIGLKTLGRIADRMEVHCFPYHFVIENQRIQRIAPQSAIEGFYSASPDATLLVLSLKSGFDEAAFTQWFRELKSSVMLFLGSVRSFRLSGGLSGEQDVMHQLALSPASSCSFLFSGNKQPGSRQIIADPATGQSWEKFLVTVGVPSTIKRAHKKTGHNTTVSIAVPRFPEPQALYAGLPTTIHSQLPFSVDAQFDPDTSREKLRRNDWNNWLLEQVGMLTANAAVMLFEEAPTAAWFAIPLDSESEFEEAWLSEKVGSVMADARVYIAASGRLRISDHEIRPLSEVTYEEESIDSLLSDGDFVVLRPELVGLPATIRDEAGRWRQVVTALDACHEVDIEEAFRLFEHDAICTGKPDSWFVAMLACAIDSCNFQPALRHPCILLRNRTRIAIRGEASQHVVLVRDYLESRLAQRFQLVEELHPIYFSGPECAEIIGWLSTYASFASNAGAVEILNAFSRKYEDQPQFLDANDLVEVRNLLQAVPDQDAGDLGKRLGRSIMVDASSWVRGKRISTQARIAECYLPSSISKEKGGDPWAQAAGKTPGLTWIAGSYVDVLRGRRRMGGTVAEEEGARTRGARRFFMLLGAEIAPRLLLLPEKRDLIRYKIPRQQRLAVEQAGEIPRTLQIYNDYQSPDLEAVIGSICSCRKKGERRDRGLALFNALSRSWSRIYESCNYSQTGYFYRSWREMQKIPATWIAWLAEMPWLTNEKGHAKAPSELGIKTSATYAVYGDAPEFFAYGLDGDGGQIQLAEALGMETNPHVSGIIEQLERIRDGRNEFSVTHIHQLYHSLAIWCRKVKHPEIGYLRIDDMSIREIRTRFGLTRNHRGLLYIDGKWVSPLTAYRGKAIFHRHRLFAPVLAGVDPLWNVLGLREPRLGDCLDVLEELADHPLQIGDEAVLIDTYRAMNSKVGQASRSERKRLASAPLWYNGGWRRDRPVYAITDPEIHKGMAPSLPVWLPPCSLDGISDLLPALGVQVLDSSRFVPVGISNWSQAAGEQLRMRFRAAVTNLQNYFARNNEVIYQGISDWECLKQAELLISNQLKVKISIPDHSAVTVSVLAHVVRAPLRFYFASETTVGLKEAGGHAIAQCFIPEHLREQVAMAWMWAWDKAQHGEEGHLELSREDDGQQQLAEMVDAIERNQGKRSTYSRNNQHPVESGGKKQPPPARKLKSFSSLEVTTVEIVNPGEVKGGFRATTGRGLKDHIPSGLPVGSQPKSPVSAPITYSSGEMEEAALLCLFHALKRGEASQLHDLSKFRGVGADALNDLKQWFEIKSSAREAPDQVTLTANEIERAKTAGSSFYLAIVSGLEEGYETTVQIFQDPLNTLSWAPSSSLIFSGLKAKQCIQIKIDVPK